MSHNGEEQVNIPPHAPGCEADAPSRHQLEERLKTSEATLRAIYENAREGILVASADSRRFVMANPAICRMLGYSEEELLGMSPMDLHRPEDLGRVQESFQAMERGEFHLERELPMLRKDGSLIYADVSPTAFTFNGQPGFLGVFRDVTEHRATRERAQMLERLVDFSSQGIGWAGLDATVHYFNPALRRTLAVPENEDVSRYTFNDFYTEAQRLDLECRILPQVLEHGHWTGEFNITALDGRVTPSLHSVFLIRNSEGRPIAFANVVSDLSEQKRIEAALRQERSFTDAVLDNANALVVVLDREGRIRRFNRVCEELTHYSFAEVKGRFVWDFLLLPEERETVREKAFRALVDNPQALSGNHTNHWLTKDREKRLIEWHNSLLLDEDGRMEYLVSIGIDVTERRMVEDALQRSEETYARAEAIAHIGSWDWDITTGGLRWTDEIFRIFGLTPKSFGATYEAFLEAIHPDDRQRVMEAVNACVADPSTPYNVEHRVVRPSGEVRIVQERGRVYRDEAGKPVRMIGTVHDVTDQKAAEAELARYREHLEELVRERSAELAEREAQLRRAQEIAHLGHWSVDLRTGKLYWSDEIFRIFGRDPTTFAPSEERFYQVVHPEDRDAVRQAVADAFARGEVFRADHRIVLPDGSIRWVHEEAVTETDAGGHPLRLEGTVHDITPRKAYEAALVQAKEEAEKANRAKSEFLSRMSHELRTPLNAILGFGQLLESDARHPLTDDQQENVAEILHGGRHLLDLINEVLDLARIESGKLSVSLEALSIAPLLEECRALVGPMAEARGIQLAGMSSPVCQVVLADRTRLKQVLLNLLSNAVKYNREGGRITLACDCRGGKVRLTVSDTGPGLSPEQQARLFRPFERLGAETSAIEGTGIGLALAKRLTELMQGEMGVDSTPGEGSTFWVELPGAQVSGTPSTCPPPQTAARMDTLAPADPEGRRTVLYIEDNPANTRLMERILGKRKDLWLITADHPGLGLDLAAAHRPHLILLDINLPDMDGYQVLTLLRARPATRHTPVIGISANAMAKDVERARAAGFIDYLTKPLNIPHLFQTIDRALSAPPDEGKE